MFCPRIHLQNSKVDIFTNSECFIKTQLFLTYNFGNTPMCELFLYAYDTTLLYVFNTHNENRRKANEGLTILNDSFLHDGLKLISQTTKTKWCTNNISAIAPMQLKSTDIETICNLKYLGLNTIYAGQTIFK